MAASGAADRVLFKIPVPRLQLFKICGACPQAHRRWRAVAHDALHRIGLPPGVPTSCRPAGRNASRPTSGVARPRAAPRRSGRCGWPARALPIHPGRPACSAARPRTLQPGTHDRHAASRRPGRRSLLRQRWFAWRLSRFGLRRIRILESPSRRRRGSRHRCDSGRCRGRTSGGRPEPSRAGRPSLDLGPSGKGRRRRGQQNVDTWCRQTARAAPPQRPPEAAVAGPQRDRRDRSTSSQAEDSQATGRHATTVPDQ
jgi:hypothetical protein